MNRMLPVAIFIVSLFLGGSLVYFVTIHQEAEGLSREERRQEDLSDTTKMMTEKSYEENGEMAITESSKEEWYEEAGFVADVDIIEETKTQSITLLSPNGGERLYIGSDIYISWDYKNLDYLEGANEYRLKIDLINRNGEVAKRVVSVAPITNKYYFWGQTDDIEPGEYKFRIDEGSVTDISDQAFTLLPKQEIHLSVVATSGSLLNIDFGPEGVIANKTGPAVIGNIGDLWNYPSKGFSSEYSVSTLYYSNGLVSGIEADFKGFGGGWGHNSPVDSIMGSYIYGGDHGEIVLHNISSGEYDLYLYGNEGVENSGVSYTLYVDGNNLGTKYTSNELRAATQNFWEENLQYVVFRNVNVDKIIKIDVDALGRDAAINALQLIRK